MDKQTTKKALRVANKRFNEAAGHFMLFPQDANLLAIQQAGLVVQVLSKALAEQHVTESFPEPD